MLGLCGLNHFHPVYRIANLGYWVRTSWTSRGVASTAARMVAHYGLVDLGLNRIEIVSAVENLVDQKAASKMGATREGILRGLMVVGRVVFDAVIYLLVLRDL